MPFFNQLLGGFGASSAPATGGALFGGAASTPAASSAFSFGGSSGSAFGAASTPAFGGEEGLQVLRVAVRFRGFVVGGGASTPKCLEGVANRHTHAGCCCVASVRCCCVRKQLVVC